MKTKTKKVLSVPALPRSWRPETKAHKFCPGCGHGLILKMLGEVIDDLNIQERVVFVCDIGCSLLALDLFNVDSIQTHHGRATPVATGIKRARPEMVCIAYMGDGGGYAIGAHHLVNAATRAERITVILANNTNYAMTGGQMSPTSLIGQKTETTPYGREIKAHGCPIKGPEMVASIVPDGSYSARGSVADLNKLKKQLKKAILTQLEDKGFSFVEALATCPTNWRTNNAETWRFLEGEMTEFYQQGEFTGQVNEVGK
ncbi:MAG: thiamine pyrophosphate-dependent enzyme [Bacillota bacterium]|jgi:2-oxoglutarate ferredoxin oxidoreductase subunit beta